MMRLLTVHYLTVHLLLLAAAGLVIQTRLNNLPRL